MAEDFSRTGNCWIDLGIGALWIFFATEGEEVEKFKRKINDVIITLEPCALKLKGEGEKINEELKHAIDYLGREICIETEDGRSIWDNVARFFFRQHINPKAILLTPEELTQSSKYSRGNCDFCGRSDLKVRAAGTSENPFIVTMDKMMTFYSNLRGQINICSNCVFASRFAPSKTIFNIRQNTLNVFLIEGSDLLDLVWSLSLFGQTYVKSGYRNFETSVHGVQYSLEAFLDFLFSVWQKVREQRLLDDLSKLSKKRFNIIQAELGADRRTVILKKHYVIPDVYHAFQSFEMTEWTDKSGKTYNALQMVLNNFYFTRNREVDTLLREELSRRILYRSEIFDVLENFLNQFALVESKFLDGFVIANFYILIEKYEIGVIGLDERVLESCRSLGRTLGDLAASTEDKSILYLLRSTRNMDDFLSALHQVFTRYVDELKVYRKGVDAIMDEIENTNWKKYKALVGIYTILRYMEVRTKGGE